MAHINGGYNCNLSVMTAGVFRRQSGEARLDEPMKSVVEGDEKSNMLKIVVLVKVSVRAKVNEKKK